MEVASKFWLGPPVVKAFPFIVYGLKRVVVTGCLKAELSPKIMVCFSGV
jgi:hypothetical protein